MAARHNVATFTHVGYAGMLEPQSSYEAVKELIANSAIAGVHMISNATKRECQI